MSSSIILLTFPSSLFDGLIRRHLGLESKFSLWSLRVMKAFLLAIVSTRSAIDRLLVIFFNSKLISSDISLDSQFICFRYVISQ